MAKKVAVVVHNYFEQAEFEEPIKALKDAGAEVQVISASDSLDLQGMKEDANKADTFTADAWLKDVDTTTYDALVLPGGTVNADHLRTVEGAKAFVRDMLAAGKPVAVICHAPWVLVSSGEAKGRRLTSFFTLQDDLRNAGADWVDEEVVVDGNLITSRNPDDLPAFCNALVTALNG